ncbi:MAG TPA: TorF family putative porin [Gammaproteobacteria bacterium]|jgi:uncharacterized protein (TIGR02001 family)
MNKTTLSVAAAVAVIVPVSAMAEASSNIGWVSEYIFRGVFQEDSSAYGGLDYSTDAGFYIGTWGADVGTGLETDLYFGFAGGDDLTWKVGYTGYFYTDDFDDTYQEVNLGIGIGIFAVDAAVGQWDGFGNSQDYVFASATLSPEKGPYYKLGSWSGDYADLLFGGSAEYVEVGHVFSLEEFGVDISIAATWSDDLVVGDWDDGETTGDYALVFGIKKTFAVGE